MGRHLFVLGCVQYAFVRWMTVVALQHFAGIRRAELRKIGVHIRHP
jgi:hypothetical protein